MPSKNYQHALKQVEFWLDLAAQYENRGQRVLSEMAYRKAERYDDELYRILKMEVG